MLIIRVVKHLLVHLGSRSRILNLWRRRKASFTRCWDLSYGIIVVHSTGTEPILLSLKGEPRLDFLLESEARHVPCCILCAYLFSAQPGGQKHAWQAPNSTHFSIHGFSPKCLKVAQPWAYSAFPISANPDRSSIDRSWEALLFQFISILFI